MTDHLLFNRKKYYPLSDDSLQKLANYDNLYSFKEKVMSFNNSRWISTTGEKRYATNFEITNNGEIKINYFTLEK